jgi:hypothetical protein
MVSGDRRLSSEYNRAVNYGVRDVVPRCERGRYIERRLLGTFETLQPARRMSGYQVPAQPVAATQALNLSAGVSNCKVSRGRSFS